MWTTRQLPTLWKATQRKGSAELSEKCASQALADEKPTSHQGSLRPTEPVPGIGAGQARRATILSLYGWLRHAVENLVNHRATA